MKTKYFIIALFTVTLTMVSCSESFLDQPPYGSVITQEQYDEAKNQEIVFKKLDTNNTATSYFVDAVIEAVVAD